MITVRKPTKKEIKKMIAEREKAIKESQEIKKDDNENKSDN